MQWFYINLNLSSSTLESDFHVCSDSLSLMMSSSQSPHSCCSSRSPAWPRCCSDLRNVLPTSCFPHFAGLFSCGTDRRSFSLYCVINRDPWSREECWRHEHRASTQLSSITWEMMASSSGEKEPQLLEGGGNSVTGKPEGSSCCPQKNPPPNSVFFPVECGSRASPLTQQVQKSLSSFMLHLINWSHLPDLDLSVKQKQGWLQWKWVGSEMAECPQTCQGSLTHHDWKQREKRVCNLLFSPFSIWIPPPSLNEWNLYPQICQKSAKKLTQKKKNLCPENTKIESSF